MYMSLDFKRLIGSLSPRRLGFYKRASPCRIVVNGAVLRQI